MISDTEHFNKTVDEAKAAGKKCVVDFTATWCGPCKMIKRTCAASEGCCQGLWHPLSDVTAASSCGRRAWCLPAGGGAELAPWRSVRAVGVAEPLGRSARCCCCCREKPKLLAP